MIETIEQLLESQSRVRNEIDSRYEQQTYRFDEPLVIVNPFGMTPLSACIKFTTDDSVKVFLEIQGDIPIKREFNSLKTMSWFSLVYIRMRKIKFESPFKMKMKRSKQMRLSLKQKLYPMTIQR